MVNLDRAMAMLIEEAAALDRRTVAQFLTLLIEDSMATMDEDKMQELWQRVGKKISAIEDKEDQNLLIEQADVYLQRMRVSRSPEYQTETYLKRTGAAKSLDFQPKHVQPS